MINVFHIPLYHKLETSLFLFILFLSLNICIARPLVDVEEASNTQIRISGKVQPLESKNGMIKPEGTRAKNSIGAVEESSKHMKMVVDHNKALESTKQEEISGFVAVMKRVDSVPLHVPHIKQDQNPGFHSDYSRPTTRPPSHN
ncbi:hypothetical protein RJT34_01660 [Clitoria ternatea]|uniref:Uncharacterized protein n=1 Tax=Clitoria ternatea TaxID=43366 RepID=A0AAN9KHA7_CLITE